MSAPDLEPTMRTRAHPNDLLAPVHRGANRRGRVAELTRNFPVSFDHGPRAFSLIEILGVLTVMAILAAALTPSLLRQMDELMRRQEAEALGTIAGGLREYMLNARRIPSPATALTEVAGQIGWPVHSVTTNARSQPRLLLVDPAFRVGTNTAATLPYVQGVYGASNLAGLRFLLVSSMGDALPAVLSNPGTNAASVFEKLWNAPDATPPADWTWGGDWEGILIQRLSLRPLFTRVVLNNQYYRFGRYSVDNTNAPVALTSASFSAWFLGRTVLGLHGHDSGPLQSLQVLPGLGAANRDPAYSWFPSYVYEQGIWRGRLFMSAPQPRRSGNDLQAAYDIFMSGPPNVYKVGGVNQASVTWSMYMFMSNYVNWANSGFSSSAKSGVTTWQQTMASQVGTYCNKKAKAN